VLAIASVVDGGAVASVSISVINEDGDTAAAIQTRIWFARIGRLNHYNCNTGTTTSHSAAHRVLVSLFPCDCM